MDTFEQLIQSNPLPRELKRLKQNTYVPVQIASFEDRVNSTIAPSSKGLRHKCVSVA